MAGAVGPALWVPLLLLLLLGAVLDAAALDDSPVVTLAQGQVRGRCTYQPGADLPRYCAFEGIPYAAPPTGSRRFQDPQNAESWEGILDATEVRPICMQKIITTRQVDGEEDCLFINVYTANPAESWNNNKLPVVVWIPSGYFVGGWGNLDSVRPDALLKQGMVVLSFNMRMGVLGFLNTQDSQAAGNAGLKDALMALRWVQQNIGTFGGDSDQVTVFGNDAAGSIVNLLLLSPQSEGLIHGAVSMSGVALSTWTYVQNPRANAIALRNAFNSSCAADEDIVPCLQSVDARTLVESEDSAAPPDWEYRFWKDSFLPSLEAPGSSATPFITTPPEQLMRTGLFLKVPYIVGFNSAERYLADSGVFRNSSQWAYLEDNFIGIFTWAMPPGLRTAAAVTEMRRFYLGNRTLYDAADDIGLVERFVQMCNDQMMALSCVSAARLMSQSDASVYVYEFAYEGPQPFVKDALYYLIGQVQNTTAEEKSVAERWRGLFTNFAKTGKPSSRYHPGYPKWKKYRLKEENYFHMDVKFSARSHILGKRIKFWRSLAQCQTADVCEQNPVVHTAQGYLRGQQKQSVAGCSYYSWNGIPYAAPPIGPLRFKDAQPHAPWEGVRDALEDSSSCPQPSTTLPIGDVVGNEDCLSLNVYTLPIPTWLTDSLPVLTWIHGGGFILGSNVQNNLGPDYFVCESIIVVTINYRLGAFGFLYLDEAASGNAGLKDQVMAQRWVQKNIAAFLGQPSEVTLGGESAGGVSVHLNVLSPLTKGLFKRAISQSGNALNRWAIQTAPKETSLRLAAAVNCSRNDSFQTVDCLREAPVDEIIQAAFGPALTELDQNRLIPFTFVPTNDLSVRGVELFLPAPAIEMVKMNLHQPVPFLAGITSRESIADLAAVDFRQEPQASELDASWVTKILPELALPELGEEGNQEALEALRQFFMDGQPLTNDTLLGFLDLLTDIQFGKDVYFTLRAMAQVKKQVLFEYIFDVSDALNLLTISLNATNIPGSAHSEDLYYLFHVQGVPEVPDNSTAALVRRRMVRLWTNYIKFGHPTPIVDPLLQGIKWKRYTEKQRNYLHIAGDLTPGEDMNKERDNFWKQFYTQYGNE